MFFSNFINSIFVMIIGMVVVFIGLVILIGATKGMSSVIKNGVGDTLDGIIGGATGLINKVSGKKIEPKKLADIKAPKLPTVKKAPAVEESGEEAIDMSSDSQLIAVITAAIMAMEGIASGNADGDAVDYTPESKRLVVRSVRRVGNAWGQAGRADQISF